MIFFVAVMEDDGSIKHGHVFDGDEALSDMDALEYMAEIIDIPMPDENDRSVVVLRANKIEAGSTLLVIKDFEIESSIFMNGDPTSETDEIELEEFEEVDA